MDEHDAEREADAAPSAKPTTASFAVKSAASSSASISSGPPVGDGSRARATMSCMCGIVMSSTANGHVQPVAIQSQR